MSASQHTNHRTNNQRTNNQRTNKRRFVISMLEKHFFCFLQGSLLLKEGSHLGLWGHFLVISIPSRCGSTAFANLNDALTNLLVNFSFARFDVDDVKMLELDKGQARPGEGQARAGRGPGEGQARPGEGRASSGRGPGEGQARPGEDRRGTGKCKGVRGRGREAFVFGGYESASRTK